MFDNVQALLDGADANVKADDPTVRAGARPHRRLAAAIQSAMNDGTAPSEAELRSKQATLNESDRRLKGILNRIVGAKGAAVKHLEQLLETEQSTHDRLLEEVTVLGGRVRERVPTIRPKH